MVQDRLLFKTRREPLYSSVRQFSHQCADACQIKIQTLCVASEAQEKRSLNETSMRQVQNKENEIRLHPPHNQVKESFALAPCGCVKFTRINSGKKKKSINNYYL